MGKIVKILEKILNEFEFITVFRYLKWTKDAKLVLGKGGTLMWEEPGRRD